MNTNNTVERIRFANTVPSADSFPAGLWSPEDLLARIDERSHPVTDMKTAPKPVRQETSGTKWRGPAIALAVAAGILLVVGIVSFVNQPGDDVAPAAPAETEALTDPLEVVSEFSRRWDAGDPTWADMFSPGLVTDFVIAQDANEVLYQEVTGMTGTSDCAVNGNTVTCDYVDTPGFDPSETYPNTWSYVVIDGKIDAANRLSGGRASTVDRPAADAYKAWLRDNHPDEFQQLVLFGATLAMQGDEIVRLQQQIIQQYREATGKG